MCMKLLRIWTQIFLECKSKIPNFCINFFWRDKIECHLCHRVLEKDDYLCNFSNPLETGIFGGHFWLGAWDKCMTIISN
jgi:hypothetical protein